jgi:hypothetical protein
LNDGSKARRQEIRDALIIGASVYALGAGAAIIGGLLEDLGAPSRVVLGLWYIFRVGTYPGNAIVERFLDDGGSQSEDTYLIAAMMFFLAYSAINILAWSLPAWLLLRGWSLTRRKQS